MRAIRSQRFKLIRFTDFMDTVFEKLFDLDTDPCELAGVAGGFGGIDPTALAPEARAEYLALRAELIAMGVY